MFKARIKNTDDVIESEDLKVLEDVRSIEFVCVDKNCNIPLIPSSYQEKNKRRPFFKKYKNQQHSNKCSYNKYLHFLEIGKTRRLTELEFEKLEYPSQLIINQPKPKESDTTTNDILPESEGSSTKKISNGEFTEAAHSNRKVSSISQIVDFYLACPYNREVDLDLLGINAPYKYQFRRIYGPNTGNYIDNKIFYGVIDFRDLDSLRSTNEATIIKLHECERWEDNPRLVFPARRRVNPYYLKINKGEITSYKMNRILKERETVINQSKGDFLNKIKKDRVEAYVFFLGKRPAAESPYLFEAIKGFVSFRYVKIFHPDRE